MAASSETAVPALLPIFHQIKQYVAQCEQSLAIIQSPAQKHSQEQKTIKTRLDAAWNRIFQIHDLSERQRVRGEIQGYVTELERLETNYKSGLTDAEVEYQRQVNCLVKTVCEKLGESIIAALGFYAFERLRAPAPGDVYQGQRNNSQHTETLKRKNSYDTLDQRKRQKFANTQVSRQDKRSIHFEEVFQDGNAPTRHIIVQWPPDKNSWYIIRCEEHDLDFKDSPLLGAASHLRSKKHGKKSSDHDTVIKLLGVQVLGCSKGLAERNNDAARDAFKNGYEHPTTKDYEGNEEQVKATQERNGRTLSYRNGHQRQHDMPEAVVTPIHGQVYRVYWKMSKQWLAALLLPMGNLEHIGIPGSIEDLGLLEDLPQCYTYDSRSKTFSWKEGYEDGGSQVSMREFPVMFFDGSPFPSKSSVAWVGVRDLQSYDENAQKLIEHSQQVLDYLEARKSAGRQEIASEARTRDSIVPNSNGEQAQTPESSTSSTSRNQDGLVDSQPEKAATPTTTPIVNTTFNYNEVSTPITQTVYNTSSVPGCPDQCPCDQNPATGDSLHEELVVDSHRSIPQPNLPADGEQGSRNDATSATNLKEIEPQIAQQQRIGITQERSLSIPEATRVAQIALNMANNYPSATEGSPMDQVYGSHNLSSLGRQQQPAMSPNMPGVQTNHPPTIVIGQNSPPQDISLMNATAGPQTLHQTYSSIVDFPQPGFSRQPYTQLPPIRPLEEYNPPPVQSWPNGAPISSMGNSRPSVGASANTQPLSLFGVLKPPRTIIPERQTRVITKAPTVLVRQTAVGTAAFPIDPWLSELPPSLVDQLKQVTRSTNLGPQLTDFLTPQGELKCPFCQRVYAQAMIFTKHLTERCSAVSSVV